MADRSLEFGRFNLIYGWNASGKTTLSSLFRKLERKEPLTEGTAEFVINGNACDLTTISSDTLLPQVRVFNREFIEANVLSSQLAPIFYLGADSIEKQRQVEMLKEKLEKNRNEQASTTAKLDEANDEVDKFCIQQAKFIKNLLSSSGGQNPYNTYNKGTFRDACKRIGNSAQAKRALLTTEQTSALTTKKEGQPKSSLSLVAFTFPDLKKNRDMAVELLQETVVSTAINDLVNNPELGSWVETGLALHSGEHKRTQCGFCGTLLPENRLHQLEAHFNDTYKQFTAKLDKAVRELQIQKRSFELLVVPDKSQIYEHLAERVSAASQKLFTFSIEVKKYLDVLAQSLEKKGDRVFEACTLESSVAEPDCSTSNSWISEINELIRQHNQQTDDFEGSVRDARTQLEQHYVAEAYEEFSAKEKLTEQLSSELRMLKPAAAPIQAEITRLEKEIVEHRQPAEELNRELESYLGRNDLHLEVSETGYSLVRETQPATNLRARC